MSIRQSMKENVARTKFQFFVGLVMIMALMLLCIPFAHDREIIPDSALVTTQDFPNQSGSIEITKQQMDWKKHIMKIDLLMSDEIQIQKLKTSFYTRVNSESTMQFIPTVDGKATIFIKNLRNDFDTLSLAFQNETQKNSSVNVDVYDDTQAAAAAKSASEGSTSTNSNSNVLYFYITQNSKKLKAVDGKIKIQSQKEYAIDALNKEVDFQNSQIKKMKQAKKKLTSINVDDNAQIDILKSQQNYQTGEDLDQNQQQISNLQTDIQQNLSSIDTANKNLDALQKKIDKMNIQISDIKSGKYEFPSDEKSQKIK